MRKNQMSKQSRKVSRSYLAKIEHVIDTEAAKVIQRAVRKRQSRKAKTAKGGRRRTRRV